MNRFPVCIAAYNEADYIARTLRNLPEMLEPIVVANGCTDNTAQVARQHNATVLETDIQGKMPALQLAIQSLGERALGPVLFTDADSFPLFPKQWPRVMLGALATDRPSIVTGPVMHTDGGLLNDAYATYSCGRVVLDRWRQGGTFAIGSNMAINLMKPGLLRRFQSLPNIWPGEDGAISKLVHKRGGSAQQLVSPFSLVVTSARSAVTLHERLEHGGPAVAELSRQRYLARAPQNSVTHVQAGF